MSIVLKENEWAEKMIISSDLGKKPSETLRRIARFYLDKGFPVSDVRRKLEAFIIQCNPVASLPKWSSTIEYAINKASKYEAINIDHICISDNEMKKIDSLDKKQSRRLAFTLLCLAKYWHVVIPNGDYWVNNKDTEIMAMANINTSIKRQTLLYSELNSQGMIQFSKKVDNTNVRVCFIEDGQTAMEIKDFRNLGYQYLMFHNEPYFECENCGIVTKLRNPKVGRKQRYCEKCATDIAIRQKVNSTMRKVF